jgi:aryl-alcohol dehydrogenase-like predicted oxidoreductase
MAQLAIAWCLRNQNVSTVILGASSLTQLDENLGALKARDALTDELMIKIDGILRSK